MITILAIDDNPITVKMIRLALEAEGYDVLTAESGTAALEILATHTPDLIIQDLVLPDISGLDLAVRIRALPGGDAIPIIAFSGAVDQMDAERATQAAFTDYLFKPVEPSRLIRTIQLHVGSARVSEAGGGRHLLLVDDDPISRKLSALRFRRLGFAVTTAADGAEGLTIARRQPPDVILSDVLMPVMDGFRFCLEVRQDPLLRNVPLVLMSAAFTEDSDQQLAVNAGANAFVTRTPDGEATIAAVMAALDGTTPIPRNTPALPSGQYVQRLVAQLERQLTLNATATRRLALCEAELAVLGGFAEAVRMAAPVDGLVAELLHRALDATGITTGAAYLVDGDGRLALAAHFGFPPSSNAALDRVFDCGELFSLVLDSGEAIALPSLQVPDAETASLLGAAQAKAMVIAPFTAGQERLGVFLMAAPTPERDWSSFAAALGSQIGQALALTRAFNQLHVTEQRLDEVLSASPAVLYVLRRAGDHFAPSWVSTNITMVSGYTAEEVLSTPGWWATGLHPDERESVLAAVQENARHGGAIDYRFRHKDGSYRWVHDELRAMMSADANREFVGSWLDVTEQKQREEAVRQAEKLSAMGQLLAGVAHELNNPLSVVAGQAELLARALAGRPEAARVERLGRAAARCGRIVKNFVALARQQPPERSEVVLNGIVTEAVELLAYPLRVDDVQVTLDLPDDLPTLSGDAHQLHQVLVNLITNAHQALRESARPRCLEIATRFDAAAGRIVLTVADNGPGIPADLRRRMFEPFFTTKPPGQGTGLGLALSKSIVESHDGTMMLASDAARGATFVITLPLGAVAPDVAASPGPVSSPARGLRVLVVDDESEVAELLADMLALDGHHVDVASNGRVALEQLTARAYDLVFSDVRMPELDGPGLYAAATGRWPELADKFLFVTGDTLGDARALPRAPALVKPFNIEDVRRAVSAAVETRLSP